MERLLDVKLTAELLGIKPVTLRLWISKKQVPYHKIGKLIKFVPSEIQELIEKTKIEADPGHVDEKVAAMSGIRYEKGRRHSDRNQSRGGGV